MRYQDILKGIKHIGFDLDGTLYQETGEAERALQKEIFSRYAATNDISYLEAFGRIEGRKKIIGSTHRTLGLLGIDNPGEFIDNCAAEVGLDELLAPDQRLGDLLTKVKEKYGLFLITNVPRQNAEKRLQKLGVGSSLFDFLMYGDIYRKVEVHAFEKSLQELKMEENPWSCVYIGNRIDTDIVPAKLAGMRTIYVGGWIPEADCCLPTIYSLSELLDKE
ncbi:MAG TPA: HAD family hydrolase [Candidatus Nanoarchaeia archaeon]|nr:HAD family hydrolase [Candidatus Nanoarchaeia archaeon]